MFTNTSVNTHRIQCVDQEFSDENRESLAVDFLSGYHTEEKKTKR